MQNIFSKIPFVFLSLLYNVGYGQSKKVIDTTDKVIICESTLPYPRQAQDNNISGTVILAFDIDSSCRIINIRVDKGIGYGCDEEAIKALKNCKPKFIGKIRNCNATFNLKQPFTFKSPEDD